MTTYSTIKANKAHKEESAILLKLSDIIQGQSPLIDRTTKHNFGYGITELAQTIRVRLGKRTVYYAKDKVNPFDGRVYRLVSKPQTKDYIIRPTKG